MPDLTEADREAIAAAVADQLRPLLAPPPLHEMSDAERDAYAADVWQRAGVIPFRPNAGRTISDGGAK